jgi:hypothetical protein
LTLTSEYSANVSSPGAIKVRCWTSQQILPAARRRRPFGISNVSFGKNEFNTLKGKATFSTGTPPGEIADRGGCV